MVARAVSERARPRHAALGAGRAPRSRAGVLRGLELLTLVVALATCDRASGRAQERAGDDPFERLELLRAKVPTPAKAFTVPDLGGRRLSLADVTEKVVLLNFWATWCPPCREEMPSMERLYRRYRDRGFTILALSIDTNVDAVAPFVRRYGLSFPVGFHPDAAVARAYGMRALPTTYLIDGRRHVVALAVGARDWDSPAAHAVVEALLR